MIHSKWINWITVFVVAIAGAIAFSHFLSPATSESSNSGYSSTVSAPYEAQNPHQVPYAAEEFEHTATETEELSQVAFPASYRDDFVQYVTVNCPNSSIVRKMYVNPAALDTLQTNDEIPNGTVIAMETYAATLDDRGNLTPTRLNNVFIREKRDGWPVNEDSGEWRSAWYSPTGTLVSNNQGACISCHTMVRDRDYVFTLPALLKAASTGLKQRQNTEFGTSVCR
ncbi:MAG: cytochrome P460 family protein [Cyanobacteria bacterium P01_C01_bin.70]